VTENSEGVGGLIMSTGSIAGVLARYALWDIGARQRGVRYGEMDGTGAGAVSRIDRLDFAYAFNRRVTTPEHDAKWYSKPEQPPPSTLTRSMIFAGSLETICAMRSAARDGDRCGHVFHS
jgi:hypothetical protein